MPTLEGIVFIPLGIFFFLKRPSLLLPLLIFSTVFQGSSVISSGSFGIQPYYCVAFLFVVRFLVIKPKGAERIGKGVPFIWLWVVFWVLGVTSAVVLPFIFQGIPVFDPRLTIEENILSPSPLRFQLGNVVQSVFLSLNVLVLIAATRTSASIEKSHKMFLTASYVLVSIILLQDLFYWFNIPFPVKLFNNNPGYGVIAMNAGNLRPSGSFTEPSMAGAVLAAMAASLLWKYFAGESGIMKAGIVAFACLLVASTSSLLAIVLIFVWLVLVNFPVRFPWYIRIAKLRRLSAFIVIGGVLALLVAVPSFRAVLLSQTVEKSGSLSAFARFAADAFAFNLALQTHGLGVGLGSNRPSSLLAALVSQMGFLGVVVFICASCATLWQLPKRHNWIGMGAMALLLSMAFGLPDLSFPFLWVLLALAAQTKAASAETTVKSQCPAALAVRVASESL